MLNKNGILKLDFEDCSIKAENIVESDKNCQEALEMYENMLESLQGMNLDKKGISDIDSAVVYRETIIQKAIYKRAFQDGMHFILNVMNGNQTIIV